MQKDTKREKAARNMSEGEGGQEHERGLPLIAIRSLLHVSPHAMRNELVPARVDPLGDGRRGVGIWPQRPWIRPSKYHG